MTTDLLDQAIVAKDQLQAESADHQPTVLVVEDDEPTRDAMALLLFNEGYLVSTATTCRDALGLLRNPLSRIDVVVLDVHLPDLSGVDLCKRIKGLYPALPVIVCSGEATPHEAGQLLALGVRRYFQKPVSMQELLAVVESALP
jgi:DNA-binding response OmpR family regulator